jgi:hypothetical protein
MFNLNIGDFCLFTKVYFRIRHLLPVSRGIQLESIVNNQSFVYSARLLNQIGLRGAKIRVFYLRLGKKNLSWSL